MTEPARNKFYPFTDEELEAGIQMLKAQKTRIDEQIEERRSELVSRWTQQLNEDEDEHDKKVASSRLFIAGRCIVCNGLAGDHEKDPQSDAWTCDDCDDPDCPDWCVPPNG